MLCGIKMLRFGGLLVEVCPIINIYLAPVGKRMWVFVRCLWEMLFVNMAVLSCWKQDWFFCWGRKSDVWARVCACGWVSVWLVQASAETKVYVHLSPAHYSDCVSHHYQCEHTHTHTKFTASCSLFFTLHLCHAHFINCSARQRRAQQSV